MGECVECGGTGWIRVPTDSPIELAGRAHSPRWAVKPCDHGLKRTRKVRVFGVDYVASAAVADLRTPAALAKYGRLPGYVADRYMSSFGPGTGLVLLGDVGVGKSYVASAIANALLQSNCRSMTFATVPAMLQEYREYELSRRDGTFWNDFAYTDLLVLDDLGAEKASEFTEATIYQAVAMRYGKKLPVIATANCSLEALEGKIGLRTLDRLMGLCGKATMIKGESWRWRREQ